MDQFGSDHEEEEIDPVMLAVQGMEIEINKLTQRIVDLEKRQIVEFQMFKNEIASRNKEQQFYIETLH